MRLPDTAQLKGWTPYRIGALFSAGGDAFPDSSGYEGLFRPGPGMRLDYSVYTRGDALVAPLEHIGGDPGNWTSAVR